MSGRGTREPVIITFSILAGLTILFSGMGITGLGSDNEIIATIGAWGTLGVGAVTAGMQFWVRGQVTPVESAQEDKAAAVRAAVSEMVPPSQVVAEANAASPTGVVAGPASDIPTGDPVTVHSGSVQHEA